MEPKYVVQIANHISDVDAEDWDACTGNDPFLCHAHLHALEASGSVSPATGFTPAHLILRDRLGRILAAAPTYIKQNSDAEIGADIGWSLAHERISGPYYPKLQVEVPFCPFPGARLLVRNGMNETQLRLNLLQELIALTNSLRLSSLHITHMKQEEQDLSTGIGMRPGLGTKFVWRNINYQSFDDYVSNLKSKARQNIRIERRRVNSAGLTWEWVTGGDISDNLAGKILEFYNSTHSKNNQKTYINGEYIQQICRCMPNNVVSILGKFKAEYICGTLFFLGKDCLYAQHWGSTKFVKFAHFEASYYQAIDLALLRGLAMVDAGAKGQHKVARGFLPEDVFHAHWFRSQKFSDLIATGLVQRAENLRGDRNKLMQRDPFRKEPTSRA